MLLFGNELAASITSDLKEQIEALNAPRNPALALVLVGNNPASLSYVQMKKKACERASITSIIYEFADTLSEKALLQEIDTLNNNPDIDGILVQLPLPKQINPLAVVAAISPKKDVDGFHPLNLGKLMLGQSEGFIPCTPLGIHLLLKHYHLTTQGQHVVIVGRSQIVGKPLAALLVQKGVDATVTVAHSKTKNLQALTSTADILVAAIGSALFVKKEHVKEGAIVIDVGVNRLQDPTKDKGYKLVGDVDFDDVYPKCQAITPVPKGVGPLTVASLLKNTLKSFKQTHLP